MFFVGRYWHRSLNPKKLIDVNFSHLPKNMTMQRVIRLYRLPEVCFLNNSLDIPSYPLINMWWDTAIYISEFTFLI